MGGRPETNAFNRTSSRPSTCLTTLWPNASCSFPGGTSRLRSREEVFCPAVKSETAPAEITMHIKSKNTNNSNNDGGQRVRKRTSEDHIRAGKLTCTKCKTKRLVILGINSLLSGDFQGHQRVGGSASHGGRASAVGGSCCSVWLTLMMMLFHIWSIVALERRQRSKRILFGRSSGMGAGWRLLLMGRGGGEKS